MLDQAAPLLYAATQLAVAVVLALPAIVVRSLRRPVKMAAATAVVVFALVFTLVLAFDRTSPTGPAPLGATLYPGGVGGVVWATSFFILVYVPLGLLALMRAGNRRS